MRIAFLIVLLVSSRSLYAFEPSETDEHSDIEVSVSLDSSEQSGKAHATVRIHAPREVVWKLITSCPEERDMVPGLLECSVLETAPDGSWQRIRQVMDYSWYTPKLTYQLKATYTAPRRVTIERVAGDLRVLRGSWVLETSGKDTVANYSVELSTGFWVPHWLVRAALRRDLPKMLRALRSHAESDAKG
ncbi:MAG TPA: SRPBCC family protein [Steroidobacteraceae bacterium]